MYLSVDVEVEMNRAGLLGGAGRHRSVPISAMAVLIGAMIVLAPASSPARTAESPPTAALAPGESAFWKGPFVDRAAVPASELCGVAGPCWSYAIEVERPTEDSRLRVAIDWVTNTNTYNLELRDPSGTLVESQWGLGSWSNEVFVDDPMPGRWRVRVVPEDVTASSFRARAKVDRPVDGPQQPRVMRPNLQVNPPWDPTTVAPVAPFSGQPADVLGVHPLSCTPDETVVNGTAKCLRFSVGPMNVARGPLEARADLATARPTGDGDLEGPVQQRLYRTDGSHRDRRAGRFEYHETHGHFHVTEMLSYRLFRVVDREQGSLESTGVGRKASFCTLDLMIANFRQFVTERPRFRGAAPCAVPPEHDTTLVMGISPGWADVYTWDLPDQYVEFGGGEGYYVIRAIVDRTDAVLETREDDNVGYGYIRIVGDRIRLLERGLGRSPWDPDKRVKPLLP